MNSFPELIVEFLERAIPSPIPREEQFGVLPGKVKVALGMRRTGKTWLMYQQIHELISKNIPRTQILYINFEDERLLPMNAQGLSQLIDSYYDLYPDHQRKVCYFFFDEIQNVEGWPTVVRRLLDSGHINLYLTGSSAKLLSKEIATALRGRSFPREIWPFSFTEYLKAKKEDEPQKAMSPLKKRKLQLALKRYLKEGGFPEIIHYSELDRLITLQEYVNTVVFRDIVDRHHITNLNLIKNLIKTLINSVGSRFTVNKFFHDMKSQGISVSKNTIHEYLAYIEDVYFAFTIPIFTNSLRKKNSNPRKVYLIDTGLAVANTLQYSKNSGHLFENLIYLDLRRKRYDISYYITRSGYEVDFVARSVDGRLRLIQVCSDPRDTDTLTREERALSESQKELSLKGELVTPMNYTDFLLK